MSEFDIPDVCDGCPQLLIVQCKDCKFAYKPNDSEDFYFCHKPHASNGEAHRSYWFCADGERKETSDES